MGARALAVSSADAVGTAPPLVVFDPNGTASLISYQVPEPTSYPGNHVLLLDYLMSDFVTTATAPVAGAAVAATAGQQLAPAATVAATVAAPALSSSVLLPKQVVAIAADPTSTTPLIALAPFALSGRLAVLSWADVAQVASSGKRVEVFRSIGGQLDYRIRPVPPAPAAAAPGQSSAVQARAAQRIVPAALKVNGPPPPPPVKPWVRVTMGYPTSQAISASSNGFALTASGTVTWGATIGPSVSVTVTDPTGASKNIAAAITSVASGRATWAAANLEFNQSGTWTVEAVAAADDVTVTASVSAKVEVTLAPPAGPAGPPAQTPTVTVISPQNNSVLVNPDANAIVSVTGTVDAHGLGGLAMTIEVDGVHAPVTLAAQQGGLSSFNAQGVASGAGDHVVTLTASVTGAPPTTVQLVVQVDSSPPIQPLQRQLVLVEKLAISSFLGNFGAGRVVKTFSLLPGEQTTITVDSYTKDDTTSSSASSILDSTASECAADFEDTVDSENDTKATSADQVAASISANVGASWGVAHATISGSASTQANASRENTTKAVQNAVAKYSSKASSNRTVSVNTDFTQAVQQGQSQDTTRTLKNINVSRVLNVVFRQMTQEHVVIIHLTDAVLGYYALDALLDASGAIQRDSNGNIVTQESYLEYSLPEIDRLAAKVMVDPDALPNDVLGVLSAIPDYQGNETALVEMATPTSGGTADTTAAYLRVIPNLTQTLTLTDGSTFTVPGIILGYSTAVMRTDQLLCDALLGEGNALDAYSQQLQSVALAERQAQVAATQAAVAKEQLAQQIVSDAGSADAATSSGAAARAAAWAKVYPQPLSVPATVVVPAGDQPPPAADE